MLARPLAVQDAPEAGQPPPSSNQVPRAVVLARAPPQEPRVARGGVFGVRRRARGLQVDGLLEFVVEGPWPRS
eukprot:990721-Pyramimonas_sp.AAC.1